MPAKSAFCRKGIHLRRSAGCAPYLKLIDAVLGDNKLYIIPCVGEVIPRGHPHGIERSLRREYPFFSRLIGWRGEGINAPSAEGHILPRVGACRYRSRLALRIPIVVITVDSEIFLCPAL